MAACSFSISRILEPTTLFTFYSIPISKQRTNPISKQLTGIQYLFTGGTSSFLLQTNLRSALRNHDLRKAALNISRSPRSSSAKWNFPPRTRIDVQFRSASQHPSCKRPFPAKSRTPLQKSRIPFRNARVPVYPGLVHYDTPSLRLEILVHAFVKIPYAICQVIPLDVN